jgi:hypothetical protein
MYLNTEGIEFLLLMFIVISVAALIIGACFGIVEGITAIWQETLIEEIVEVEVVDKVMSDDKCISYCILVKGITPRGEEYCEDFNINKAQYASIQVGDILHLEYKITTKPLFGERESVKLVFPETA